MLCIAGTILFAGLRNYSYFCNSIRKSFNMKYYRILSLLSVMLLLCVTVDAQKLTLVKKHPAIGEQWESRFGLTGRNKPAGFYYRLRDESRVPNLMRSETTEQMQLIISENTNFGAFGLFRNSMNEETYAFVLALYNKEGKLAKEYDLCRITGEYMLELQDIRYEKGRFYFNMACPTYSDNFDGRCSRMYCIDGRTGKLVWQTDFLTSNDIIAVEDDYIVSTYGFSNEKDFVFLLDKNTGDVLSRMSLDRKAQYIEVKDSQLFVIDAAQNVYVFNVEM